MKLYTHEEMLDSVIGVKGTPRRDEYEAKVDAFLIGEAIKQARESRNITQEQLGEMIGVKKATTRMRTPVSLMRTRTTHLRTRTRTTVVGSNSDG